MIKRFCDICGKEIQECQRIYLVGKKCYDVCNACFARAEIHFFTLQRQYRRDKPGDD